MPEIDNEQTEEQLIKSLNDQNINRVFKEVTVPQLHKMCEWFKEDTGKESDWMHVLMACVAAAFLEMYEQRGGLFNEKEKSEDEQR